MNYDRGIFVIITAVRKALVKITRAKVQEGSAYELERLMVVY
jgi:hypothetical protein